MNSFDDGCEKVSFHIEKKPVGSYQLYCGVYPQFILPTTIKPSWFRRKCMKFFLGFDWLENKHENV